MECCQIHHVMTCTTGYAKLLVHWAITMRDQTGCKVHSQDQGPQIAGKTVLVVEVSLEDH